MGAAGSSRRSRAAVTPEPDSSAPASASASASLPPSAVEGKDSGSCPPAGAKNPSCLGLAGAAAAGSSTAPPGSSPSALSHRASPSPSGLDGKGSSALAAKVTDDPEEEEEDSKTKTKAKTRTEDGRPIFLGRCRACRWEDRVPLFILYKHVSSCGNRKSVMIRDAERRHLRQEQEKKCRRHAHTKGKQT